MGCLRVRGSPCGCQRRSVRVVLCCAVLRRALTSVFSLCDVICAIVVSFFISAATARATCVTERTRWRLMSGMLWARERS